MKNIIISILLLITITASTHPHTNAEYQVNNTKDSAQIIDQENMFKDDLIDDETKPSLVSRIKKHITDYADAIIVCSILGIIAYTSLKIAQSTSKSIQGSYPLFSEEYKKPQAPQTNEEYAVQQVQNQSNRFWYLLKRAYRLQ